jgi:decaprenylphospho-beta-D-erythro-pentofuranosid-2-ulose 2-reductase
MTAAGRREVLLIGGSSEIALAIARRLAADGPVRPYLLGRDRSRLEESLAMLHRIGCAPGALELLDADDLDTHGPVIARAFADSGGFDLAVLAIGVLGAQEGLDADPDEAAEVMRVNFVGCGSLLLHCTRRMRGQGRGTVVVLSSVAAERARAGNAIYGAAKAGLDALAQGLADAGAGGGVGVRVLVVRPGFVRTRMTRGLPAAPLATTADEVADATVRALAGRAHTIWVPGRLRPIFIVLRHLPRRLYRRLPL